MKKIFILALLIGIVFRFYLQFLCPAFNVDEISLGNNIKNLNFLELLYPLSYGQSCPPLYLWIQKMIILISPFDLWISFKILSFTSSCLILLYFFKFAQKYNFSKDFILIFLILIFNPYIVYNSLTLKQYSIDLLGVIILVYSYDNKFFKKNIYIFFLIWSLISNIGLFSCVGYLAFLFFKIDKVKTVKNLKKFIISNLKTFLSIVPYTIYFLWFMQQDGALELKSYMKHYWSGSFLTFDSSILKFLVTLMHGFWVFFFSMNEIVGLSIFLISVISFFFYLLKKKQEVLYYSNEIYLLLFIFLVHLVLNVFQLYPLSDRLYLYLSLLFFILFLSAIKKIFQNSYFKKYSFLIISFFSLSILFSYKDYILFKENDIVSLNNKLELVDANIPIYFTNKSIKCINDFNDFTEDKFKSRREIVEIKKKEKLFFYVTRVSNKFKPHTKSNEENEITLLQQKYDLNLYSEVKGYNIYKVKMK